MSQRPWERNFPEPAGDREVVRDEVERLKRRARDLRAGLRHLEEVERSGVNCEVRRALQTKKLHTVEARIFRLQQWGLF
jgi:hypothetical protein